MNRLKYAAGQRRESSTRWALRDDFTSRSGATRQTSGIPRRTDHYVLSCVGLKEFYLIRFLIKVNYSGEARVLLIISEATP